MAVTAAERERAAARLAPSSAPAPGGALSVASFASAPNVERLLSRASASQQQPASPDSPDNDFDSERHSEANEQSAAHPVVSTTDFGRELSSKSVASDGAAQSPRGSGAGGGTGANPAAAPPKSTSKRTSWRRVSLANPKALFRLRRATFGAPATSSSKPSSNLRKARSASAAVADPPASEPASKAADDADAQMTNGADTPSDRLSTNGPSPLRV